MRQLPLLIEDLKERRAAAMIDGNWRVHRAIDLLLSELKNHSTQDCKDIANAYLAELR